MRSQHIPRIRGLLLPAHDSCLRRMMTSPTDIQRSNLEGASQAQSNRRVWHAQDGIRFGSPTPIRSKEERTQVDPQQQGTLSDRVTSNSSAEDSKKPKIRDPRFSASYAESRDAAIKNYQARHDNSKFSQNPTTLSPSPRQFKFTSDWSTIGAQTTRYSTVSSRDIDTTRDTARNTQAGSQEVSHVRRRNGDTEHGISDHDAYLYPSSEDESATPEESEFGSPQSSEDETTAEDLREEVPEPLAFQVPAEALEAAIASQGAENATHWTHELYRGPAGNTPTIYYCRRLADVERVALLFHDEPVLGFDIEWASVPGLKRTIKNNVSLIQVASPSRIGIFHIALHDGETIEKLLGPNLKRIMESPDIIKTGVAIKGDCTRLRTNLDIESRSIFELSHLHRLVKYCVSSPRDVNRRTVALKDLVFEHLQLPLAKGPVRTSAWEKPLNMEQVKYAAADAYAGVILFDVLERKRMLLRPRQPRPAMAETDLPIRFVVVKDEKVEKLVESDEDDADETDSTAGLTEDTAALKLADDRVNIAPALADPGPMTPQSISKRSKAESSAKKIATPKATPAMSPELQQASRWAETFLAPATLAGSSEPKSPVATPQVMRKARASLPQLRAYNLWYHQQFSTSAAAAILRDPPLKTATVASYVLQAVHCEALPFDESRLQVLIKEVPFFPDNLKYSKILGKYMQ